MTSKERITKIITNTVAQRTNFFHCLKAGYHPIVLNWSLVQSLVIFTFITIKTYNKNILINFFGNHAWDLFSISISAIGIILAAISVIVAVYSKEDMQKIVYSDKKTFESFLFPYRYAAFLWSVICIISLLKEIHLISITSYCYVVISYIWIFFIIYAILYFLFLIKEMMESILLSSLTNKFKDSIEDTEKKNSIINNDTVIELERLKILLENGYITKKDFENKKKQLLDL